MSDQLTKLQLTELLDRYTVGSILHLLAEIYEQAAREAEEAGDAAAYRRCKLLEHTLFVMGLGIDSANPS